MPVRDDTISKKTVPLRTQKPISLQSKKTVCLEAWPRTSHAYTNLISDPARDSRYLRDNGLKPTLLEMMGDCSALRVLDVGCGDGWLLDKLTPLEGYGCDIVDRPDIHDKWDFQVQDIRSLTYSDGFFDVVVASLVLIWFDELDLAMRELHRIIRPGGKCIIALVHPYFYRTGSPDKKGNFVVEADLSKPFEISNLKIGGTTGPLTYFYRPFTYYLNSCIQAGLKIDQVTDWFLDMRAYMENIKKGMASNLTRTGKVPMYSFIKCSKE